MDYGYHAPTLSFHVHGTLMIEPLRSRVYESSTTSLRSCIQYGME